MAAEGAVTAMRENDSPMHIKHKHRPAKMENIKAKNRPICDS